MSEQTERSKTMRISWIIWGLLVTLVIFLASAFSQAWSVHQALKDKEALLEPMLTQQQEENATLQAQLTYVQSDAYIEKWAQENAKMAREEETLVLFIAPTPTITPTPTPSPSPIPTATEAPPFWQQWWRSLRGE